jgi:type IV pilus assembly protein PilE
MVQYAGFAERIFTETNSYVSATTGAAGLVDTDFYTYAAVPTATAFTITITAQGGQANDACGTTLSLTNTGATSPATAGCW